MRQGPRLSQMSSSFLKIADVSFPTETHLEQISFGKYQALAREKSCQEPSLQSGVRFLWRLMLLECLFASSIGQPQGVPKAAVIPVPFSYPLGLSTAL